MAWPQPIFPAPALLPHRPPSARCPTKVNLLPSPSRPRNTDLVFRPFTQHTPLSPPTPGSFPVSRKGSWSPQNWEGALSLHSTQSFLCHCSFATVFLCVLHSTQGPGGMGTLCGRRFSSVSLHKHSLSLSLTTSVLAIITMITTGHNPRTRGGHGPLRFWGP